MKIRKDDLLELGKALTGPAVAVLFWITVLLICVIATAQTEFFKANAFEAIGAVGQVFFAAAVFWLGLQQFRFTQQTTKRQHNIDAYPLRNALITRVEKQLEAIDDLGFSRIDYDFRNDCSKLMSEIYQLFPIEISSAFFEYSELVDVIFDKKFNRQSADFNGIQRIDGEIAVHQIEARKALQDAIHAMEDEMSIVT